MFAVDKKYFKNNNLEVLWEDKHLYYINNNENSENSLSSFNPNYSLVVYDKDTSTVGIVNGYFIIKLKQKINDIKGFENQSHVNVISSYPDYNIIVARAKEKSNINDIFNILKVNTSIKEAKIEVIDQFPEPK